MKTAAIATVFSLAFALFLAAQQKDPYVGTMQHLAPKAGKAPVGLVVSVEAKRELAPRIKGEDRFRYIWAKARVQNKTKAEITGTVVVEFTDGNAVVSRIYLEIDGLKAGGYTQPEDTTVIETGNAKRIIDARWKWEP
jgi:hypothetical protein